MGNPVIVAIVILLILAMFGAVPIWPHSANWGYVPSGGLGLVLLIVLMLLLWRGF